MNKAKSLLKDLKWFNWSLFIALCTLSLVPTVYSTVRTFLISTNASSSGIDVIGQMEWFDLIDETIRAFLVVPLYSILNKIFKEDKDGFPKHVFKTGIVVLALYTVFSFIVFFYGIYLVQAMNPETVDTAQVFSYLQLETIAFMVGIITSFVNVVFVVVGKSKNVYIFMVAHVILGIITDFAMIPNLGIDGVAYSNILTNSVMAVVGIIVLLTEGHLRPSWFHKGDGKVAASWAKTGAFSGGQQFVDNIVYALMIGKMVNMVAEQGNYWVANNFIWGWLLIPVSALGEIIKRDCKDGYLNLKQGNYYLIILFSAVFWSITIPGWEPFFQYAEQLENHKAIFDIVIKLAPFYIAYGLTIIPDSIFIGTGKTIYSLVCSLVINIVYYGIFFICYKTGALVMSMDAIILMFGFGMVAHLAISLVEEKRFLKPREVKAVRSEGGEPNMRYVFFDIECSNCFGGIGKMCEFGFVITDEKFKVLNQGDYVMNPGDDRNCRFWLKGRKDQRDLELAYDESEYKAAPLFDSFYDNISYLFCQKDVRFFGFSVAGDIKYLSDNIKRYGLKQLEYEAVDVQTLLSHFKYGEAKKDGLEKTARALCSEEEMKGIIPHRPDYDSLMTALVLKHMCSDLQMEIDDFVGLCPDSVIDAETLINKPETYKNVGVVGSSHRRRGTASPDENEEFNSLCDIVNPKPKTKKLSAFIFSYSASCKCDHMKETIEAEHFVYDNGGMNHRGSVSSSDYIVAFDEADKELLATKLNLTVLKAITIKELYGMIDNPEKYKKLPPLL